jgi:hypothetical protein
MNGTNHCDTYFCRSLTLTLTLACPAQVFDAALAGGGAKAINFQDLAADLAHITFEYPFRIPPYFALIIRAIGVLEGIALVGNEVPASAPAPAPAPASAPAPAPAPLLYEFQHFPPLTSHHLPLTLTTYHTDQPHR